MARTKKTSHMTISSIGTELRKHGLECSPHRIQTGLRKAGVKSSNIPYGRGFMQLYPVLEAQVWIDNTIEKAMKLAAEKVALTPEPKPTAPQLVQEFVRTAAPAVGGSELAEQLRQVNQRLQSLERLVQGLAQVWDAKPTGTDLESALSQLDDATVQ